MSETNSLKIMVTGAGKEIPFPLLNEDIQYENRRNLKMKKVVKFGGSSLASAEQFRKVGEIIHAEKERRYVVPSAPGKRYSGDTKVTDMLYDCYNSASANGDISGKIKAIQARYQEIIDGLGLELSLDEQFAEIKEKFEEGVGSDYAASRGEFLNGIVMAAYLGYEFVDAAEVIRFDEDGVFDAVCNFHMTLLLLFSFAG